MKTGKRIMSALLCLIMLTGTVAVGGDGVARLFDAVSVEAFAEDEPTNGQCGDNLYWSFDADTHTLTISGTGDMYNYGKETEINDNNIDYDQLHLNYLDNPPPWDIFRTQIRKIDILPGCTSVGDFAFFRCWYVSGIAFPEGVETIGDFIFSNSYYNISKVFFPSTLTSIGSHFAGFGGDDTVFHTLKTAYGGNNDFYFDYTSRLEYISLYNAKYIDDYVLYVNEQNKTATIVAYVGYAENVDIPGQLGEYTVTGIGADSFYNCDFIKNLTIPETVSAIEFTAFRCSGIENYYIPKSVTKIGEAAFISSTVNYAVLDNRYGEFSDGFPYTDYSYDENGQAVNLYNEPYYLPKLKKIVVDSQNPVFSSDENGVLYNKDKTVLFQYPFGLPGESYVIPDCVVSVWNYAFRAVGTLSLKRIYVPRSVEFFAVNPFEGGTTIDYEGSRTEWENIINASYYPADPYSPNESGLSDYDYQNYCITDLIWQTENYVYGYISFPRWSMDDYNGLTIDRCTVNFNVAGSTNGKCGDNLFWSFDAATHTLTISGTGNMYDYGGEIRTGYYYDNNGNETYYNDTPEEVYLGNPPPWDYFRTEIRKIDIQPGCTSVGNFAFFRCWYVGGIIFPEGITEIGDYMFGNSIYCISKIYFPSTLESVGSHFCVISNGVSFIHRSILCFGGDEEIVSFNYSGPFQAGYSYCNTKVYDDYILNVDEQTKTAEIVAYVGCDEQIDIPQSFDDYTITSIGAFSFFNCMFLKGVTLPQTIVSIKNCAFQFSGVENFYVPKNVSKIGIVAFLSTVCNCFINDEGYPDAIAYNNDTSGHPVNAIGEPLYISKLNSIIVDSDNPYFSNDDNGVLYNKNKSVLFQYPIGSPRKSFVIPDSVINVWSYAFLSGGYSELERVYIPKNVSMLALNPFSWLILDYEGTQAEWNNMIISSYPTYPEIPNRNYWDSLDYMEQTCVDLLLNVQIYNYYYEQWNENDGFGIDYCTINFNVTDPMNGVTPDSITYSWSSDGKSCTGTAVYNDFSHTVTENATVTSRVYSNATCTAPGTTRYTATFSNTVFSTQYKDIQNISALGHSKKWVVTTTATCTREGVESYKCSRCQTVFDTRTIEKLPHNYSSTVVNPTCTQGGYTTHTCSSCGYTYTDSYTSAAGHRYTDYVTKPTCTEQGYTLHYCSVCHDSYKDNYTDPAHTPGNPVVENASNTSCDVEGSYDEVVYCTKCGSEISREHKITVAGQHTPAEAVKENEIAATCEKNGSYDLVVYCAICKNEITRQTVATQKTGHKDTNSDGMCDTCKKVVDKEKYNKYLVGKAKLKIPADTDVEYGATVTVKAKAIGVPSGYYVALYDGGTLLAKGSNTEVSYTFPGEFTSTRKLTVKIIDADRKDQKDANGKDLAGTVEIKAKSGFFDKLIAFFKRLFKALPAVTVEPK